ncbi:hypothetical protein [Streptomyces rhizosphaerihabitans]|uniref:hypothetical protein n=1 Tax=Streptomyces rhizosphaerihabitans TaxID=1266770 RepID=UPI0021BE0477|nr:hypothetical protein [Streptomyces rhizosphaerihabitans]MCT9009197.1 hypothetical protein [Streptomyces rhizosphaerihabitans]
MGGDAAEAGGAHTAAHALGAVEDARAATTAAFATTGLSTAAGPASGVLLTAAAAAVVATTGFTAASGASAGVLLVTTAAPAFAPAAGAAALFAATAVAATAALTAAGTTVATAFAAGGATVTASAAALTAALTAAATALATAALTAAGPTSGVLLVAATAAAAVPAAAVSAATLTATAVPAAVTVLAAVVDAAVPEVTGVAAALATEATAVTPEPAEVATGSGTAVTETGTGAAITQPARTAIGTAGSEAAIAEPARTAIGTAGTEPAITEPARTAIGTAGTEPAEVTQAAVGAALGTPTDMSPEPAEVRPVLVPEPSEVAELTESAAHINRRLLDQPPAEQALGAGGGDVEAAGALVAVSGKGEVGRVVDGGVVTGDVVGRDIRNVMVRQRVCRAPEEQRRLGQPRVECGRSPGGAGLDAEGTEFADLRGCQAESSGHLLGVTVEFGPEGRVDGKAGHGIAKGVVGHVLGLRGSAWVCVRCCLIPAELRIPLVGGNCHFRPSPPMPARTVIRGTA